jgi:N6-L-threonylcarbamoyladenine synthase
MPVLAFETSCDETSAAVVHQGAVLSNTVSSQVDLHLEYGGVVPELAAREHLKNLLPIAREALGAAGITLQQLDAVAATQGPGLPGALMAGLKAGQSLAFVLQKPFYGIHHHEAHLYSPWIGCPDLAPNPTLNPNLTLNQKTELDRMEPNVSLIVSGGHTMLVHVRGLLDHQFAGGTVDDAAGECFDKIGKLIGLTYPAGPEIDRLAEQGDPGAFDFPRPMLNDKSNDFSFSGLKTSVRYRLRDNPGLLKDKKSVCDLCASVQAAIVSVLVTKTVRLACRLGVRVVTASGGVTCNRALRSGLAQACAKAGIRLRLAARSLCTDNAGMIGVLAEQKLLLHHPVTPLDEDIKPGWSLAPKH